MTELQYYMDDKRHLVCEPYSIPNLHRMAEDLGIKRCWFHRGKWPHYDIPKQQIARLRTRCEVVSARDVLGIIRRKS